MDYKTLLALWALYAAMDKKQHKLLIYTFVLLSLMKKCYQKSKIFNYHNPFYNKEEVNKQHLNTVYKLLQKQYIQVEKLIEDVLIDSYENAEKILNEELHININSSLETIKNIVNETWVGSKNFKQRLEWNLREIFSKFKEILENGGDLLELEQLQKNYFYRLRRLLDTETHHTINSACQRAYEVANINFVEWIATMDEKTCPICRSYDRRIFIRQSAPFCPDHPFCRCILAPSTEEDYKRWISQSMG